MRHFRVTVTRLRATLAINSKLRGCDVVAIQVEDVAAGGYTADGATIRQKKTGRPVRSELSEQTRAIDDYLKATSKRPGDFLFAGRRGSQNRYDDPPSRRVLSRTGLDTLRSKVRSDTWALK
jgi:integrase